MYHVHSKSVPIPKGKPMCYGYGYRQIWVLVAPKIPMGYPCQTLIPYFFAYPFKILEKLVEAEHLMFLEPTQRLIYPLLLILYHSSY